MAGLLLAQKIARSSQIKIVAGEGEAGARLIERMKHFEALFGLRRDLPIRGNGKEGVGAGFGASDTSAKLIKLRQPEHIGAMHDKRIGGGDIETRLHDRRG